MEGQCTTLAETGEYDSVVWYPSGVLRLKQLDNQFRTISNRSLVLPRL